MFVGSIARVEHMGIDPARRLPWCARCMMSDHQGIDAHGGDGQHRVAQRFTFRYR